MICQRGTIHLTKLVCEAQIRNLSITKFTRINELMKRHQKQHSKIIWDITFRDHKIIQTGQYLQPLLPSGAHIIWNTIITAQHKSWIISFPFKITGAIIPRGSKTEDTTKTTPRHLAGFCRTLIWKPNTYDFNSSQPRCTFFIFLALSDARMKSKTHTMDLLWEKFQWIPPLYMKPISFQSKASVVCSVTAVIFIDFCLKKLNVFSNILVKKKTNIWILQNKSPGIEILINFLC